MNERAGWLPVKFVSRALLAGALGLRTLPQLAPHATLWFESCNGVHTFCLRYPIAVLMLDADRRVLALYTTVRPCRIVWATPGTWAVVEPHPDALRSVPVQVGHRMIFRRGGEH